ncbi:MAG TPA: hypothetical protein PKH39_13360 [Woeseiaceae bacterium]|nr:hypothetical protein [Woeseiaceae bacterium]
MSSPDTIDVYLIHATLDSNSGSQIGFPPTIQGLARDATISNLITLLGNLHSMGHVGEPLAPAAVARMQFWGIDGTTLAHTQPLNGLPEPRVVLLVSWQGEKNPVLSKEQAKPLADSILNYARENDDNFANFFGSKDVPTPQGAVEEPLCEILVRFSFLKDKIDVFVTRAGREHLSFAAGVTPAAHLTGYGLETTFGAAEVPPFAQLPPELVQIAVTLEQRLSALESLDFEQARPIVNETNQTLADNYIKAADYCPVNSRFIQVQ